MKLATSVPDFTIRSAIVDDCTQILSFIQELADYEKLGHEVVATPETLEETLFGERSYKCIIP